MIIGQTFFPNSTTPSQVYYYTPWFPRGGDKGVFAWELIDLGNPSPDPGLQVTVVLQTKNSDDTDSSASGIGTIGPIYATSTPALAAGTIYSDETSSGAKELVRYRFEITGDNRYAFWAHLRALEVSWASN